MRKRKRTQFGHVTSVILATVVANKAVVHAWGLAAILREERPSCTALDPSQVAQELRRLERLGLLERAGEEPGSRGSNRKLYRVAPGAEAKTMRDLAALVQDGGWPADVSNGTLSRFGDLCWVVAELWGPKYVRQMIGNRITRLTRGDEADVVAKAIANPTEFGFDWRGMLARGLRTSMDAEVEILKGWLEEIKHLEG